MDAFSGPPIIRLHPDDGVAIARNALPPGAPLGPGFAAFQKAWGDRPNPPAVTAAFVSALAHPDFLVEIDAGDACPVGGEPARGHLAQATASSGNECDLLRQLVLGHV